MAFNLFKKQTPDDPAVNPDADYQRMSNGFPVSDEDLMPAPELNASEWLEQPQSSTSADIPAPSTTTDSTLLDPLTAEQVNAATASLNDAIVPNVVNIPVTTVESDINLSNLAAPTTSDSGGLTSGSYSGFPTDSSYSGFPGSPNSDSPLPPGVPADATVDPQNPNHYLYGGKGGGDTMNGSFTQGVYSADGEFLGENMVEYRGGNAYYYGVDYKVTTPPLDASGSFIEPASGGIAVSEDGTPLGHAPAGSTPDPDFPGHFLYGGKGGGDSVDGSGSQDVYDSQGNLLGENTTIYKDHVAYKFGVDFGSTSPSYDNNGNFIVPTTGGVPVDDNGNPVDGMSSGGSNGSIDAGSPGTSPTYSGFPSAGNDNLPAGVPAGAIVDPLNPDQYIYGGHGGGDDQNGSSSVNVYDKSGNYVGVNETYHLNGQTYNYGVDYGNTMPDHTADGFFIAPDGTKADFGGQLTNNQESTGATGPTDAQLPPGVPAGATVDPLNSEHYLYGGKGGGDSINGEGSQGVFDGQGNFLGENKTVFKDHIAYKFGVDYGNTTPSYDASGNFIEPATGGVPVDDTGNPISPVGGDGVGLPTYAGFPAGVPASATADPYYQGHYLYGGAGGGDTKDGSARQDVYDQNGQLIGQDITQFKDGKAYQYGVDFGGTTPPLNADGSFNAPASGGIAVPDNYFEKGGAPIGSVPDPANPDHYLFGGKGGGSTLDGSQTNNVYDATGKLLGTDQTYYKDGQAYSYGVDFNDSKPTLDGSGAFVAPPTGGVTVYTSNNDITPGLGLTNSSYSAFPMGGTTYSGFPTGAPAGTPADPLKPPATVISGATDTGTPVIAGGGTGSTVVDSIPPLTTTVSTPNPPPTNITEPNPLPAAVPAVSTPAPVVIDSTPAAAAPSAPEPAPAPSAPAPVDPPPNVAPPTNNSISTHTNSPDPTKPAHIVNVTEQPVVHKPYAPAPELISEHGAGMMTKPKLTLPPPSAHDPKLGSGIGGLDPSEHANRYMGRRQEF